MHTVGGDVELSDRSIGRPTTTKEKKEDRRERQVRASSMRRARDPFSQLRRRRIMERIVCSSCPLGCCCCSWRTVWELGVGSGSHDFAVPIRPAGIGSSSDYNYRHKSHKE